MLDDSSASHSASACWPGMPNATSTPCASSASTSAWAAVRTEVVGRRHPGDLYCPSERMYAVTLSASAPLTRPAGIGPPPFLI